MMFCVQFVISLICHMSDTPCLPLFTELAVNNSSVTRLLIDRFVD